MPCAVGQRRDTALERYQYCSGLWIQMDCLKHRHLLFGIVADSTCSVNLQCSPNSIKILYYPSGLYGLLLELSEALVPFQ